MASLKTSVRLTGISRSFGTFLANDKVSLAIHEGTIHALVGENGAGKSTLSNIMYGLLRPDSGTIELDGRKVSFGSPRQAIKAGIGMVHQHFMLIPTLTVAENIVLGDERSSLFTPLPKQRIEKEILELSRRHGMEVDPGAPVSSLSVGQQQRVEILKVLYRNARLLILDEPTAVLSPPETEQLFRSLRSLTTEGRSVMLVTHKLDEVLEVSDEVSVMRKGRLIGTLSTSEATRESLARMMVGRDVLLRTDNPPQQPGKTVLSIEKLEYRTPDGRQKLRGLDLTVRAGEIYGIAGVEGNGQSELLSLLWGSWERHGRVAGKISIEDVPILDRNPAEIADMGVSMIPEDRLESAVVPEFSIGENLLFGRHREKAFHRGLGFDREKLRKATGKAIADYDIRFSLTDNPPISSLSGGNQQKLVLARELERPDIRLLVLAQPTRGVDIGAIELIHRRIVEARVRGIAILLVSSELEELIALSTRIGCLFEGAIRHEFSEEEVRNGRISESGFEKEIGLYIT